MVQHHEKYEEIHGEDKIVMMDFVEHHELHVRLRKEGKCTIPREELHKIAHAAYMRTEKAKRTAKKYKKRYNKLTGSKENCIVFTETIGKYVLLVEIIKVNPNINRINYGCTFRSNSKVKLIYIDI